MLFKSCAFVVNDFYTAACKTTITFLLSVGWVSSKMTHLRLIVEARLE